MKKPPVTGHKQGAASRGLQLVALIRGVPTSEELYELHRALRAASESAPISRERVKQRARGKR
jgi:hypothetical protein